MEQEPQRPNHDQGSAAPQGERDAEPKEALDADRLGEEFGLPRWVFTRGLKGKTKEELGLLSPAEIVAKAAELPDRLVTSVSDDERIHCPRCNAAAAVTEKRCQWCGEPLVHD